MMRRQRAQSMIEFALIAMPLFMLIFGVVDFGRAIGSYNTAEFLARDIDRYLIVPSHTPADAYVLNRCKALLTQSCYTSPPSAAQQPNAAYVNAQQNSTCATVAVTYWFQPVSFMIANLWGGGTLQLQATSKMFVEPAQPGGC
jgi:Flp pilus assembly protein TadG